LTPRTWRVDSMKWASHFSASSQDVADDIVRAAHRYGIKVIAACDLSVISSEAAKAHPDWLAVDRDGKPFYNASCDTYHGCVMGGYAEEYGRALTREILERYDVDGMKFGGGSYGFQREICYCDRCKKSYREMYGEDIPLKADWYDPHWLRYYQWRTVQAGKRVQFLRDMVTSIKPDMPVMGNGVCFSDIDWTVSNALDMEEMAAHQDMIQIEAQTRCRMTQDMDASWQTLTWTGEEANFMTAVTDKPIWVVVSYFRAWPWRRSAMEYAEQKAYLAQIVANGASPMINLSGGPPKVHEDQRGFQAPSEIWHFIRDNREYYTGDRSGAEVALVASQDCMIYYGKEDMQGRYLDALRGYENALIENHIPFDMISPKLLHGKALAKYKTLILPNLAYLSDEACRTVETFHRAGGGVIGTFECSLYDEKGERRTNLGLADVFRADAVGKARNTSAHEIKAYRQSYARITDSRSALLEGIGGTTLVSVAGDYLPVEARAETEVPLRLTAPFIVFPEGLSYPTEPDSGDPFAVVGEAEGAGRSVYFSGSWDKLNARLHLSDVSRILANAVLWTLRGKSAASLTGPETVYLSLRTQPGRILAHLVNLTGGRRYIRQIIPVSGLKLYVTKPEGRYFVKAYRLSDKRVLPMEVKDGGYEIAVDTLRDYDVIVLE